MEKLIDSPQTILPVLERLMNFADRVQAMRMLQRKQETRGIDEVEWNRLNELKNAVDAFFMLPEIPRALAQ